MVLDKYILNTNYIFQYHENVFWNDFHSVFPALHYKNFFWVFQSRV